MTGSVALNIEDLKVSFQTRQGKHLALDGVSFQVRRGETLGLVGESGCGKTVASLSILGLLPPNGRIESGSIDFHSDGNQITGLHKLDESAFEKFRGRKIAMIFQEPMTALNPVLTIEKQISEQIEIHYPQKSKAEVRQKIISLLDQVGIPSPEQRLKQFPHQLSGGMRQRAMIAMALSCDPDILIADEPTTALDVTIQAQILELLKEIQSRTGMAIQFITHDLGVLSEISAQIAVMYAGKIVEIGPTQKILKNPAHPYTQGLLKSIPQMDVTTRRLPSIEGTVPAISDMPTGCRFAPRCTKAQDICRQNPPKLSPYSADSSQQVACFFPGAGT